MCLQYWSQAAPPVDHHGEPKQHDVDAVRFEAELVDELPEGRPNLWEHAGGGTKSVSGDEKNRLKHLAQVGNFQQQQRLGQSVLSARQRNLRPAFHAAIHRRRSRVEQLRAGRVRQAESCGPFEHGDGLDLEPAAAEAASTNGSPGFEPEQRDFEGRLWGCDEEGGIQVGAEQ